MAMQTQVVSHPYVNERDQPNWRRRCKCCGEWTIVHYKASNVLCDRCKNLPEDERGKIDLTPYQYWKVIECPDPWGYRPGAVFTAMEWSAMKKNMVLIPGMVVEQGGGKRERVLDNLKVVEEK